MISSIKFGKLTIDYDSIRQNHLDEYDPMQVIEELDRILPLHKDTFDKIERMGADIEVLAEPFYFPPERSSSPVGIFFSNLVVKLIDQRTGASLDEESIFGATPHLARVVVDVIRQLTLDCMEIGPNNTFHLKRNPFLDENPDKI